MGNDPDGLIMSQARDRATIDNVEDASFRPRCGVGRLVENAPHVAVALRRSVAVVHACALFVAGAGAHPRGKLLGRREDCCRRRHRSLPERASMVWSILCSLLNMCSRCFAGHCQTTLLGTASTASPTGSPKSLPKRATSRRPENGQRLVG